MYVYALIDPNTRLIRYIGKTVCSLKERLRQHLAPSARRAKTYKTSWIRSLIAKGLRPYTVLLDTCYSEDALNRAEVFWIAYYRRLGAPLTNATDGGDGQSIGYKASKKTRKKLSTALKGKTPSKETKGNLSESRKGFVPSEITRQKLRIAHLGKSLSHSTRHKMSEVRLKTNGRLIDENGIIYLTVKEAVEHLGVNRISTESPQRRNASSQRTHC
jgi:group I intron endonuclease